MLAVILAIGVDDGAAWRWTSLLFFWTFPFVYPHFPALSGHMIPAGHALIPLISFAWWMKLTEGSREVKHGNCLKALRPARAAATQAGGGWVDPA